MWHIQLTDQNCVISGSGKFLKEVVFTVAISMNANTENSQYKTFFMSEISCYM